MSTKAISDASFEADVLNSSQPVLVDFWAEWCGPCRVLGPTLEELAGELGDRLSVVKVNIDENPEAPARYGVRSIPTMILFKDGAPVATQVGAAPKSLLKEWVERGL
jgi:thioredoxin 1